MKHYRILEKKFAFDSETLNKKEYVIQYQKRILGVYYWKNINNITYNKYEEAFNEAKQLIVPSDYDNTEFGYHYIDVYKLIKSKETKKIPNNKSITTK